MYKDLDRFEPKQSRSAIRPRGPDPIAALREENDALKTELKAIKKTNGLALRKVDELTAQISELKDQSTISVKIDAEEATKEDRSVMEEMIEESQKPKAKKKKPTKKDTE